MSLVLGVIPEGMGRRFQYDGSGGLNSNGRHIETLFNNDSKGFSLH